MKAKLGHQKMWKYKTGQVKNNNQLIDLKELEKKFQP